jgi:hypothetical protein
MDHIVNELKLQLSILEEFFQSPEFDNAKMNLRNAIKELEKHV